MYLYIKTGVGLGQPPMLHGSLAGRLGEGVKLKEALDDFENQLRSQPEKFKKLLLTVTLHPAPTKSKVWWEQSFPLRRGGNALLQKTLQESTLTEKFLAVMKGISNTSFQKQINDEQCLQAQMILATMNVWFENYLLLWSDLKDIFLADLGWEQGPAWMGLTSLARDWASRALLPKLPGDRAKQLMQSDASEANFAFLGGFLRRHAQDLYNRDLNFREQVVVRRKEMEKRRKEAEKAKEAKEPQGPKRPRRR